MTILRCKQNLKLDYDTDELAVAIINNPAHGFTNGCFWVAGELYEVTGYEFSDLMTHYPEHFEKA